MTADASSCVSTTRLVRAWGQRREPSTVRLVIPNPLPAVVSALLEPLVRRADDVVLWSWERLARRATIGPNHARARSFRSFGDHSAICAPVTALFGERYIEIGSHSIIGPYCSISAGVSPDHDLGDRTVIRIGDRTVIGRNSSIAGHLDIELGDDIWTGPNVYITDENHGYEDVLEPIGRQFSEPRKVVIGSGSWLGTNVTVLPGVTIGEHVAVGAGAVVTRDIPAFSVAVGNPARVIRRYDPAEGWIRPASVSWSASSDV